MTSLLDTEEEIMLRDAARGFLDGAAPIAALRANRDAGRPHDPGLWREMAQMGWAGVLVTVPPASCRRKWASRWPRRRSCPPR